MAGALMASGRSIELGKLRRHPVFLTEVPRGPFTAQVVPTATRAQLDVARAKVRRTDARRTAAAVKTWCR